MKMVSFAKMVALKCHLYVILDVTYLDMACPSGCNCVDYNKCNWSNQLILVLNNALQEYTHAWNWHFWLFRQNICDWNNRKVCCCGTEQMQPEKIKPVQDCKWGPWHATVCSKSCGGGVQTLKRIKKQRRRYGKAKNILYILFSLFRKKNLYR